MIVSFLIIIFLIGITINAEQNPPPVGGGDNSGDWIIENGDTITRENQEIRLEGNLYIKDGGKLTFKNVTLKMNSSKDGEFKIEVKSGGEFNFYDNDDNKGTTFDASVITAYNTEYEFLFHVRDGAKMIMKNSELYECGPGGVGQQEKWGWLIWSSDVLIDNSTISDSMAHGIRSLGDASFKIINCTISNNWGNGISINEESSPVVIDNKILNNDGIYCSGTSSPIIINNFISSGTQGLSVYQSANVTLINTTIKDYWYGIWTDNTDSAKITLINCTIEDSSEDDIYTRDDNCDIISTNLSTDGGLGIKNDGDSRIFFYNFLHVKVINDEGEPIPNALVRVRDGGNGNYDETFYTGPDGWKRWILILLTQYGPGGKGYAPFTINATSDDETVGVLEYWSYVWTSKERTLKIDFNPPEISNVQTKDNEGDSILITWETNENCDSRVKYGFDQSYGLEKYNSDMIKSHSVKLTNLESDRTYHFCVNTTDGAGNYNESKDFVFKTLDIILPEIYNIKNSTPTGTSVLITWNTDEPSNSTVEYGFDESYGFEKSDDTLVTLHSIELTELNSDVLYHFSVKSTDDSDNSNQSVDYTFLTLDILKPVITKIENSTPVGRSVTITWKTNEPCDSLVKYGLDDNYGETVYDSKFTNSHSIILTDLESETLYHFSVNSTDDDLNSNQSVDHTFATLKDTGDTEPPENPIFSPANSEKVNDKKPTITITFTEEVIITEAKLNGIDILDDLESSDYIIFTYTPSVDLSEGDNTISVKAKDLNDNEMSASATSTFTIEIIPIDETSPVITAVSETGISQNSTYITWTTDEPSTGQIEYGITDSYGNTTDKDTNPVISHNISITNLEPNTTYHYRMISIDEFGNENISEDYIFKTLEKPGEPPVTEEINIEVKLEITETEIKEKDEVTIKASVTNKGTTSIEVDIVFMDNDKKIGEEKITIEAGKTESSSFNWTAQIGNHTIKIVVKSDGKELSNGSTSKKIEVTEVDSGESGFNMILLVPIIIIPIVVVIGLIMRNRGGEIKPQIPIQQNVPQQTFQTQQQTQVPQQTPQQAFKKCPYCNAQVPGQFKFCNMCGKEMELKQQQIPNAQPGFNLCPYCNAQVPGQFKFCNMCGKEIKKGEF